jgi:hypothetical protein
MQGCCVVHNEKVGHLRSLGVQVEEEGVVQEVVDGLFEIISCEVSVHECYAYLLIVEPGIDFLLRQAVAAICCILTLPKLQL